MGYDSFAVYGVRKGYGTFIVKNISHDHKVINIFQYPIPWNKSRDLLKIPGVAEDDIRASLLKGELCNKILVGDIQIIASDVDLLQFNFTQKTFLQKAGVVNGLDASGAIGFLFKQDIILEGVIDGVNRIFTVPSPDKFINGDFNGNIFKIQVFHNGRQLLEDDDYTILESEGVGTGYDTVELLSFTPRLNSKIFAHYIILN
jgi:hypothetical protein